MSSVVIVDAYSTGAHLAAQFERRGVRCIHVQTSAEILDYDRASFRPEEFADRLVFGGDLERLALAVERYRPDFVIPGCESGVHLADRLSERLGTPGNGTALTECRRDKWAMAARLHELGVPAAKVAVVDSVAAALAAVHSLGGWPLVIKPVNSAGADGIHFCADEAELRHGMGRELGRLNEMGFVNDRLLAMELLVGQQYLVQAVTRDGEHHVFEIWRDTRRRVQGAGVINDREQLIALASDEAQAIVAYVRRCLDAFGVQIGPSFLEVMVTARGPILIEWAARMMGTQELSAMSKVHGANAVDLCVACYTSSESFQAELGKLHAPRATAEVVGMVNRVAGRVTHRRWLDEVRALPSFHSMIRAPEIDSWVEPTIGISTNYGFIYLVHADASVVERDYRWIRDREARPGGFFDVIAAAAHPEAILAAD